VGVAWKLVQKQCTSGNQGLSSHSEETNKQKKKKGKVFGILSQLKKLSKSNDVLAQNNTFAAARNELLLPLKIRVTEGGDIMFIQSWVVTCIKMYLYSAWCLHTTWP